MNWLAVPQSRGLNSWRADFPGRRYGQDVDLAIAIVGAVAALAAADAAVGSWLAARRANARPPPPWRRLSGIGGTMRLRRSLRSRVRCWAAACWGGVVHRFDRGAAERHASVSVTILDEARQDHWAHGLPDGVTQAEAEAFVWRPLEFNTLASAQVVSPRESSPPPMTG